MSITSWKDPFFRMSQIIAYIYINICELLFVNEAWHLGTGEMAT